MHVLHIASLGGSLGPDAFGVWGEALDPLDAPATSFGLSHSELRAALVPWLGPAARKSGVEAWGVAHVPTAGGAPVPSRRRSGSSATGLLERPDTVSPVRVALLQLDLRGLFELLEPIGAADLEEEHPELGADVRFWLHLLRFAAGLVVRERYVPALVGAGEAVRSHWRTILSEADGVKLAALAQVMPPVARALALEGTTLPATHGSPRSLTRAFVEQVVDALVRRGAREAHQIGTLPAARVLSRHDGWLQSLGTRDGALSVAAAELAELAREIPAWQRPLEWSEAAPWRLAVRLEEPVDEGAPWTLRFLLRPSDDPSLLVPLDEALAARGRKATALRRPGFETREFALVALGQAAAVSVFVARSLGAGLPGATELDLAEAHQFLTVDAAALEQAGFVVLLPAWWAGRGVQTRLSAKAQVRNAFSGATGLGLDTIVTVDWQVALGDATLSPAELQMLARLKAPLVKLRGQWVELDAGGLRDALARWQKRGSTQLKVRDVLDLALGRPSVVAPLPVSDVTAASNLGELNDLLRGLKQRDAFRELPEPPGFVGTLRPYQRRGWSWLKFLRRWRLGACLADDMGLGKTVQTLALLADERAAGEKRPVLLVCPTSIVGNWQRESARFAPALGVLVHHGSERTRAAEFVRAAASHALVLTSYSLLQRDFEALARVPWAGVILDEAQNIKNPETKQARAARSLAADWRIALTGTPVENHVGDLWSIFEFLNPGLLGSREAFRREFLVPIRAGGDEEAVAQLRRRTGPFILRRLKSDPAILPDLPAKLEHKVVCNLTREQASLYAAVLEELNDKLHGARGIERRGVILASLMKLKQVCNHPAHFLKDGSALEGRSGKLARLGEMLDEIVDVGERALVFTQFREMGDLLVRDLAQRLEQEILFLHGGTPRMQRQELVDRFQAGGEGPAVFVLSLKAGGTGLNLTRAAHVFHFDRWWNPAVETQATDRAHRIGQKQRVQVHKFVCAGTLEERIDELLERKKEIADRIVGGGETWLTELTTEQLQELVALGDEAVAE